MFNNYGEKGWYDFVYPVQKTNAIPSYFEGPYGKCYTSETFVPCRSGSFFSWVFLTKGLTKGLTKVRAFQLPSGREFAYPRLCREITSETFEGNNSIRNSSSSPIS